MFSEEKYENILHFSSFYSLICHLQGPQVPNCDQYTHDISF